ncbi:MAG TPA: hypothetical protein VF097_00180 [Actinomycetota bacterium]
MGGRVLGLVFVAMVVVAGCGEQVETVGTTEECIRKVGSVVDQEFLEERNSSLVEIGAGKGDLVGAIAKACVDSSPEDPVEEVAERAVKILNPDPPEEK